jgi:hypothetical protein
MGADMAGKLSQADSDLCIEYRLRLTRRRMRLVHVGGAAMLMAGAYAVFLLAAIIPDHWVRGGLSEGVRVAMLWGLLIVPQAAIFVGMILCPLLRRLNDLHVARLIEKAHPELLNDLTSALQLAGDPLARRWALTAVKRRAAQEIFVTDVQSAVRAQWLYRAAAASCALLLAAAIYLAASGRNPWASLARAHGGPAPWPTRTRITLLAPDSEHVAITGQPVDFAAEIRHGRGNAQLRVSRDGQKFLGEDTLNMRSDGRLDDGEKFIARWLAAAASGESAFFQIACGDAVTPPAALRILPAPALRDLRVQLEWPAYTGRGRRAISGARVEALAGTTVWLDGELNLPLRGASVLFGKGDPILLEANDVRMWGSFVVHGDDRYRVAYRGRHEGVQGESIAYEIKAVSDQPPAVRVAEPADNVTVAINEALHVAGEASDDFGLWTIDLAWRRESSAGRPGAIAAAPESRLRLVELPVRTAAARQISADVPAARFGSAGERFLCHLEARDHMPRPDGSTGQVGRSQPFTLTITPVSEQFLAQEEAKARQEAQSPRPPKPAGKSPSDANGASPAGNRNDAPVAIAKDAPASDADAARADINAPSGKDPAGQLLAMAKEDHKALDTLRQRLLKEGEAGKEKQGQDNQAQAGKDKQLGKDLQRQDGNVPETQPVEDDRLHMKAGSPASPSAGGMEEGKPGSNGGHPPKRDEPRQGQPNADEQEQAGKGKPGETGQDSQGQSSDGTQSQAGPGQPGKDEQGQAGKDNPGQAGEGKQGQSGQEKQGQGGDKQGQGLAKSQGQGQGEGQGQGQPAGQSDEKKQGDGQAQPKAQGPEQKGSQQQAGAQQQGETQQQKGGAGGQSPAEGLHSPRAGGGAASDPSKERGPMGEDVALSPTAVEDQELASIGRVMDEAIKQIRGGDVDPALLKDLGMTAGQFKDFVDKYSRQLALLPRKPDADPAGSQVMPKAGHGSREVEAGANVADQLLDVRGAEKLSSDQVRKLRESRSARVAPEYRKAVEDYFRAISEGSADSTPTSPAAGPATRPSQR